MQELPDDHLDELFRKSAEEFEPSFDPRAWEAMRQKLDEEDRVEGGGFWFQKMGVVVLVLLLLIGGGYWWFERITPASVESPQVALSKETSASPTTKKTPHISPQSQATKAVRTTTLKDKPNEVTSVSTLENKTNTAINDETEGNTKKDIKPSSKATQDKRNSNVQSPEIAQNERVNGVKSSEITRNDATETLNSSQRVNKKSSKVLSKKAAEKQLTEKSTTTQTTTSIALGAENKAHQNSRKSNTSVTNTNKQKAIKTTPNGTRMGFVAQANKSSQTFQPTRETHLINSPTNHTAIEEQTTETPEDTHLQLIELTELPNKQWRFLGAFEPPTMIDYIPLTQPLYKPKPIEEAPVFSKGLSVRAATTPDWSYITASKIPSDMPLGWSVMLEYRFSRRWSVQTGVVRSLKRYGATAEQYVWPASWSAQVARPTWIDIACKVLDVPLNLRFDLSQGPRSRWFVSSGLSSYRMLNERYDYTYPPHTYNVKKYWEGASGNYWLGVMNLNVGFEHQISRRWSVQAEPFLKVPLKEVGWGKIKLHTAGAFVSLRYKLPQL